MAARPPAPPPPATHSPNSGAEQRWLAAAEAGDVAALRSLLAASPHLINAPLHHQTFKRSTALHLAVWRGRSAAVEFLLDHGADIELQDQAGMTALQVDVMRICLQKMRPTLLLRSRCIDIQSPVAMAMSRRRQVRDRSSYRDIDTSVLDLLLDHNACVDQPSESGDTALLNAAEYGLIKHVEKLLAHGADASVLDQQGRSAMDIAGEHGFTDIVNALADNCPSLVNSVGDKTLVMAVRHEYAGILETLYDRVRDRLSEEDGEELGSRLLNIAAEYDAPSCALFLLQRGISADWTNAKGENAVQVACARGRPEILEMLLQQHKTNESHTTGLAEASNNAMNNAAVLSHPSITMDVLQNCDSTASFLDHDDRRHPFPVFVAVKMPANLEIMEVLIRHSAKFDFPTRQSRDSIVPLLASWLLRVAPADVSKLLVDLASSEAIRHKLRHVIHALTWQKYIYEALVIALLILFSPQAVEVEQALAVFKPWMVRCEVNLVTRTLLTDALST
ncbi:Ankyrin repeat domain-containing protein 50 [Phytophthora cinnamomi]|uniref:Ankyrin repeat domain-containing protein 50 n=1 Tax=Phytophthora cinnamomi TaxID=4785 RepID=UPI0035596A57|nr:Ankyrin repeat domain-containing protein 50 [Phytophthora cinnamomi]